MWIRNRQGWWQRTVRILAVVALITGVLLMGVNLYGLTQPLRKPGLGETDHEALRFVPEQVWSYERSLEAIDRLDPDHPDQDFLVKANQLVNQILVHVDWNRVDAAEYRQLIPVWENYFLHILGRFSGLSQFERYHFADYRRNIRRGIGICGDAATILSSVLDRYGVDNRIVSFAGHVLVEARTPAGDGLLLDPDFGVELEIPLDQLALALPQVRQRYLDAGYPADQIDYLMPVYSLPYRIFDNTYHFMSRRFLFEEVSYVLKWVLPLILIAASLIIFMKPGCGRREKS